METYRYTSCGEENTFISLGLFIQVSNAGQLRTEAASGKLEAVLLDPTLIVSPFHIQAAATKALQAREQVQMKTKNIYSEVIFSLSPTSSISNSFKQFGVKDKSSSMLVVFIHEVEADEKISEICGRVQGTIVPISQLSAVHNEGKIIQFYDVPNEELAISSLENAVVTRLAIKDAS